MCHSWLKIAKLSHMALSIYNVSLLKTTDHWPYRIAAVQGCIKTISWTIKETYYLTILLKDRKQQEKLHWNILVYYNYINHQIIAIISSKRLKEIKQSKCSGAEPVSPTISQRGHTPKNAGDCFIIGVTFYFILKNLFLHAFPLQMNTLLCDWWLFFQQTLFFLILSQY